MSHLAYERITIPALSDDENATLNSLLHQLHQKSRRNLKRAAYYDGKHAVRAVGSLIPPPYWRLGLVLGWSAKAVDMLARRCNLDGWVWPDGDLESLGMRELEAANFLDAEISAGAVSSLLHGVSFLVTTRGEEGEPDALVHVKDALNATGHWNHRRRALDNLVSVHGWEDGRATSLTLYLDGETITAEKTAGRWSVDRSEHGFGVPVDPLVYRARVGRPFGTSRISRPVMAMQDAATRTVIRMEAHNDIYAIPDLWMFGADQSIFKNADGSQKANWQVMMGRIKAIPDSDSKYAENTRADAKQFPASSPTPHIESLQQQAMQFAGETSIPLTSLGVSDQSNPTSADSYIASREDLIAEAEGATDDWTPALRRTIMRAFAVQNGETSVPESWSTIAPKWRSPIYLSRAAQADAGAKQLGAVPWLAETEVGLELLGLDPQQIRRAQAERRRASGRALVEALVNRESQQAPADGAV